MTNITLGHQVDINGDRGVITNIDDDILFITLLDGRSQVRSIDEVTVLNDLPKVSVGDTPDVDALIDTDDQVSDKLSVAPDVEDPEGVFGSYAAWYLGNYTVQAMNDDIQIFQKSPDGGGEDIILFSMDPDEATAFSDVVTGLEHSPHENTTLYYSFGLVDRDFFITQRYDTGEKQLVTIPYKEMISIATVLPVAVEWVREHPFF